GRDENRSPCGVVSFVDEFSEGGVALVGLAANLVDEQDVRAFALPDKFCLASSERRFASCLREVEALDVDGAASESTVLHVGVAGAVAVGDAWQLIHGEREPQRPGEARFSTAGGSGEDDRPRVLQERPGLRDCSYGAYTLCELRSVEARPAEA